MEPDDTYYPVPTFQLLWIRTASGATATGWHDGFDNWITDAFRIVSAWDTVTHWAVIEYPEG